MEAVEFQATVKNGIIEIPQEYLESLTSHVRVILLPERPYESSADLIDRLLAHPVRLKGFRPLGREDAHAR